ncbi:MAG: phosphoribosyl-ATP pyrophosphohydrolase [Rickettsiales bacterium]|jgi:phosphoribosyl-ATP pyrophosphohydrolase
MTKTLSASLDALFSDIQEKIKTNDPTSSYTAFLANSGSEKIAKKVVEEAFELATASIDGPGHKNGTKQIILESADLFYHSLVLLASRNVDLSDVMEELEKRRQDKNLSRVAIDKNQTKLYGK